MLSLREKPMFSGSSGLPSSASLRISWAVIRGFPKIGDPNIVP